MTNQSTIDTNELNKFSQHASDWWKIDGPLKTLHDINPARMNFIRRHISFENNEILDIGCGGGILSEAMAKEGAVVIGLDAEPEAIKSASIHAKENGIEVNYVNSAIENYNHKNFDIVTCMEMLEHVQNPQLVLDNAARLTKPGGFIFLSTINRTLKAYASVIIAAEYVLKLLPKQTHDYDKFIKPSELAAMARKAGLEVIGINGLSYDPYTRNAELTSSASVNYLLACRKF